MQLVLFNSSVEDISQSLKVSTFPVTTEKLLASFAKNDHDVTKNFVSELLTEDTSPLKVELWIKPHMPTLGSMDSLKNSKIFLYPSASYKDDPLKRLVNRCHHVTISIDFATLGAEKHDICWLSVSGMKMDPESSIWGGSEGFYDTRFFGSSPCRMKVTAHIPDDVIPAAYLSQGEKLLRLLSGESYFDETTLSDACIISKNGAMIQCHRSLLSASSSVLEERLKTGRKEGKIFVDMSDTSEKAVKALVRYLYCDNLDVPWSDLEIAYELLCTAHAYRMPRLMGAIVKQTMESWLWNLGMQRLNEPEDLRVKIAFKIYLFARRVDEVSVLKEKMIQYLIAKIDQLDTIAAYIELFEDDPDAAKGLCRELVMASMN